MPKQTFYNLPVEKQTLLLKISKEEFSKKLFSDVSINKIIKDCGISRGSFYMYFNDKEDLYQYLIKTVHENLFKGIKEILNKNKGDLFETFEELFEKITNKCGNENQFMQKVFLNAHSKNEDQILKNRECNEKEGLIEELIKQVDFKKINSEVNIKSLLKLHFIILSHSVVRFIKNKDKKEEIKNEFLDELKIIKNGYKEDKW